MRQNNVSWQYYISDYPYLAQLYDRKTQNKIRTQKVHAQRERYRRTARKEEKRKEEKRKEEKSKRAQKQNLEEERGASRCKKNKCERNWTGMQNVQLLFHENASCHSRGKQLVQ